MSRLLIYQYYNKNNKLDKHVLSQLLSIKKHFITVIFVSNSLIDEVDMGMLLTVVDEVILRDNKGYDFGAWRDVLFKGNGQEIGKGVLTSLVSHSSLDWLYLMNSTCFGPIGDIREHLEIMESKELDFWGWTNHKETIFKEDARIWYEPEHIQSYFMGFRRKMYMSEAFKNFWLNVKDYAKQDDVIQKYEVQMTDIFKRKGFVYEVWMDCKNVEYRHNNVMFFYPLLAMMSGVPFVKVKSFLFSDEANVIKEAMGILGYDIKLVNRYFKENHGWR